MGSEEPCGLWILAGGLESSVRPQPWPSPQLPNGQQRSPMDPSNELSSILSRRAQRSECSEADLAPVRPSPNDILRNLSRKEVQEYKKLFKRFDKESDGYLDLEDMKRMMESIGAPQTHLSLKQMIAEVDDDKDGKICFNDFLLIYHKAKAGELESDSGLSALAKITEVDINEVGVDGAKNFFEAKIEELRSVNKFEEEVKREQEEKRRAEDEKKAKRLEFAKKHSFFEQVTITH